MTVAEPSGSVRSWLYVPGDRPDRLERAGERGADALIVDLEDSVAPAAKDAARETVAKWLRSGRPDGGSEVWVRVNNDGTSRLHDDLAAVAEAGADGVLVPKATAPAVTAAAALGPPVGALVETAAGLASIAGIAAVPGVHRLSIGEADLAVDLGLDPSPDEREWWPYRAQVVLAAAAAGLEPPCGPVSTDFEDLDALRASTDALRRAGFGSRSAIHPAQVPVINEVFTPSPAEVEGAAAVVAAYDDAVAAGRGTAVGPDGRMLDEAVVRVARRVLARAAR